MSSAIESLATAAAGNGVVESARQFALRNWDTLAALLLVVVVLVVLGRALDRRALDHKISRVKRHLWMLGLTFTGLLWVILTLDDKNQADLLKLFGLLLTAAIAFSSTTLIGNAMAGFMLRAQRHFRLGDYLRVGDHFGSVSERGLFFTEIQNDLADYVTLPNSYLATHPVTVWRTPSTLVKAEVSLGYDVPRRRVKELLLAAAESAGLGKPFVHILALGDFAVTYRVAGVLADTRELLTARSKLNGRVLDRLHEGGVEIVSPAFMNQRQLPLEQQFIPPAPRQPLPDDEEELAEAEMFAKAVKAATVERLSDLVAEIDERAKAIREEDDSGVDSDRRRQLARKSELLARRRERLLEVIAKRREDAEAEQRR